MSISNNKNISYWKSFQHNYILGFGEFSTDEYTEYDWVLFFISSLMIPLVMLNMLISIISDSYYRLQAQEEIEDLKQRLGIIIDSEYMFNFESLSRRGSYYNEEFS